MIWSEEFWNGMNMDELWEARPSSAELALQLVWQDFLHVWHWRDEIRLDSDSILNPPFTCQLLGHAEAIMPASAPPVALNGHRVIFHRSTGHNDPILYHIIVYILLSPYVITCYNHSISIWSPYIYIIYIYIYPCYLHIFPLCVSQASASDLRAALVCFYVALAFMMVWLSGTVRAGFFSPARLSA